MEVAHQEIGSGRDVGGLVVVDKKLALDARVANWSSPIDWCNLRVRLAMRKLLKREEPTMARTHKGECFCGAVRLEVSGEPEAMGYCHCRSCRSWSGGPVNAFTLWKPSAVRVTAGAENVAMFQKTEVSQRQYCRKCGGHLMTNHPPLGLVDVFAATLPTLKFSPRVHVNYAETVLPMRDGVPKLKDFPKEFGGSGEVLPE
jgi:hypothetical protein